MRPDRPLASSPIASLLFAVVSLALCLVLITLAFRSPAAADAPLCAFSRQFERQLIRTDGILGAAVYDLDREIIWSGGHSGPYAMHSVIKPPIAWAVLSDAEAQGRELTTMQRDALFYMVAWSQNPDVELLLGMIGGLTGLAAYYERWGVPELTTLMHPTRWGINRATPRLVARLYAALATSRAIPEAARTDGLDLLRAVIDEHRWAQASRMAHCQAGNRQSRPATSRSPSPKASSRKVRQMGRRRLKARSRLSRLQKSKRRWSQRRASNASWCG